MSSTSRSQQWFGRKGKDGFIYRAWMKSQGHPPDYFDGRPVIGICNTWSELTPCNAHFRELAEHVRRGILDAGGFPLEFPVMSLGETMMRPTAMLFRNLASMDVEETIRANPLDGVVLLCGCDKTTPSLVMGACSVNLPAIVVSGGPMLTGKFLGGNTGISDVWRFAANLKADTMTSEIMQESEAATCRSSGHCNVLGTASSLACMVESLGLTLPQNAAIPASDARRKLLAHMSGRRIVEMVKEDLKPSDILTRTAFENSIRVNTAIGGSTNFVVHLLAIAGRVGVDLSIDDFDRLARNVPLIANLQPSGTHFMEDLFYAGGLPAVIKELSSLLHHENNITVTGKGLVENCQDASCFSRDVISTVDTPFKEETGLVILKGNLSPNGAVMKPSAASKHLLKHKGKAVVFENIEDYKNRVDDPDLNVDGDSILVLKNVGPKGYPGMAEVGNMTLPSKVLKMGITDMVRISDGRMSGTAFGAVILHVSPEAAVGGTLALVENGDEIELDVEKRSLNLLVDDKVLTERKMKWKPLPLHFDRGYINLYQEHVLQADKGADLDFLVGRSGSKVGRDNH